MSKFTHAERELVKSVVASLTIKRVPESEIIQEVFAQTNKTLSRSGLFRIKESIKKDSDKWWFYLAKNSYAYMHEFKERLDEIIDLQKRHHQILDRYSENPKIVMQSLQELHKLNVTLSGYWDVAPEIKDHARVIRSEADRLLEGRELVRLREEVKRLRAREQERETERSISVPAPAPASDSQPQQERLLEKAAPPNVEEKDAEEAGIECFCQGSILNHYECEVCHHVWCPSDKSQIQKECPNCNRTNSFAEAERYSSDPESDPMESF